MADYSYFEQALLDFELNEYELRAGLPLTDRHSGMLEKRFNPNHDPDNGRFCSGKGIDKSVESGIIESKEYDTSLLNSSNIEISDHAIKRAAERGITKNDIIDAIDNPLAEKPVKLDNEGRPSFQRIGENATAAINPQNRRLTSTWKTHTKLKLKLKGQ